MFVLLAPLAQATITVYTDLASFQAAAGTTSLETFSSATVAASNSNYVGGFNGFSITSISNGDMSGIATGPISTSDNFAIPTAFNGQKFYGWGQGLGSDGSVGPTSTFHFAAGTTAFGFDWFNTDFSDTYSLTVNGQTWIPFTLAGTSAATGFFGVVATAGTTFSVASIQTNTNGGFVSTEGLDNVRVSSIALPEPESLALLGLGLLGLMAVRRRKN